MATMPPAALYQNQGNFDAGDRVTVFGDYSAICKTFGAKETFIDDKETD